MWLINSIGIIVAMFIAGDHDWRHFAGALVVLLVLRITIGGVSTVVSRND